MSLYKISVSKAKTFESCERKFEFNYLLKLKPKDFLFFDYGKMLHKVLEDFHQALIDGSTVSQNVLMAKYYKEALKEYGSKITKEDIEEAYKTVDAYLQYLANDPNPPEILLVEKNFKHPIKDVVSLVGMIDRIQRDPDGVLHLLDYKTSKNMKYYEDDFFQLLTYAYIMLQEDPTIKKIRCSYMFLRHNFQCITKEFEPEEIMKVEEQYVDYALKMQADHPKWEPNPSYLCNWCGFLDYCPEGKKAVLPKPIKNGETSWT